MALLATPTPVPITLIKMAGDIPDGDIYIPQPADYEGEGTSGIAIYRPSSTLWAIRGFNRQYWGGLNNIPVN